MATFRKAVVSALKRGQLRLRQRLYAFGPCVRGLNSVSNERAAPGVERPYALRRSQGGGLRGRLPGPLVKFSLGEPRWGL